MGMTRDLVHMQDAGEALGDASSCRAEGDAGPVMLLVVFGQLVLATPGGLAPPLFSARRPPAAHVCADFLASTQRSSFCVRHMHAVFDHSTCPYVLQCLWCSVLLP